MPPRLLFLYGTMTQWTYLFLSLIAAIGVGYLIAWAIDQLDVL
jgi:hypothetical protein